MPYRARLKKISGNSISIKDVQEALGVNSNDLGTLCTSKKINRWSKYKPVIYKVGDSTNGYKAGLDTIEQLGIGEWKSTNVIKNSGEHPWWEGYPKDYGNLSIYNCGIVISWFNNITNFINNYNNRDNIEESKYYWNYIKPLAEDGFRLLDFYGYYNDAVLPFSNFLADRKTWGYSENVIFSVASVNSSDNGNISLSDFPDLAECYFGVIYWKTDVQNPTYKIYTSSTKIKDAVNSYYSVTLPSFGNANIGNYEAIGILCSDSSISGTINASEILNYRIYSMGLLSYLFNIIEGNDYWINIDEVNWEKITTLSGLNTVKFNISFSTARGIGSGNYNEGNYVRVSSVNIKFINNNGTALDYDTIDSGGGNDSNYRMFKYPPEDLVPHGYQYPDIACVLPNDSDGKSVLSKSYLPTIGDFNFNYIWITVDVYTDLSNTNTKVIVPGTIIGPISSSINNGSTKPREPIDLVIPIIDNGEIDTDPPAIPVN